MSRPVMKKPRKIVAIGGGTGMHVLLTGLHRRGDELAAIITVADDGGSSGRLRKEFAIPPPGDIRNCLVALSDADPILGELFQYRFDDPILQGHAFGNLFIAVLARLTGDFRAAIERARALLGVRGRVIPSTDRMVVLVAEHPDGSKSTGEQVISHSKKPIQQIRLVPVPPPVSGEIEQVVAEADLIVLGPGSLYSSIIPNLLVPGMIRAINRSDAKVLLVMNLMTQPGETDGFDLEAHVRAFRSLDEMVELDAVLASADRIEPEQIARYAEAGALPVTAGPAETTQDGTPIIRLPLVEAGPQVRHSPNLLAEAVHECLDRMRSGGEVAR